MAELNKLILPVKNTSTGVITNQEFDLPSGGGSSSFEALTDVDIDDQTLANGDVPVYNSTTQKWENGPAVANKMDKANPTGTGSFSLNRKASTTIGNNSVAEGNGGEASGSAAHAEGVNTKASGQASHAEGYVTEASTTGAHAEGKSYNSTYKVVASGEGAHAEGVASSAKSLTASGEGAHAEGKATTASGTASHAEGYSTTASASYSHAAGYYNTAGYTYQTVVGKYNSNKSTTLFEVGNGTSDSARSNAFEVYSDGSISMDNGVTKFKLVSLSQSITLSTSSEVTATFTSSAITTDSKVDVYTTDPNLGYKTMSISSGSCSITYDKQDSASTITVSIDIH